MKPLQGKVAIVTGASSPVGIGAAVARRLAASGAKLLLVADDSPEAVAKECAGLLGDGDVDTGGVVPLTVDLGDADAVLAMVAEAEKRFGRIVNISSVVGATGNPGQVNYVAAKAGLIGMTKSLAQEVASRGITVNAVAPGFIASALTEKLNDDQRARILGSIPLGRMGAGSDIGAAVAYLASGEAAYVTGQTLHVNGGMAML